MENTKAKNVVITILIILLVAVICFGIYYIVVMKNSNSSNEQEVNNTKLQEEIAAKEIEIADLKKSNDELKKQVEEFKNETEAKNPTINREPIELIGKTLGEVKKKYGISKEANVSEGQAYLLVKNDWKVAANIESSNYKVDSLKVSLVRIKFKDLFNNYSFNCANQNYIKSFFGKDNVDIEDVDGQVRYTIRGEVNTNKGGVLMICFELDKNDKITENTQCDIWYGGIGFEN